jgi:colicin import membrane protein
MFVSQPNVHATEVADEVVGQDESQAAAPKSTSAIVEYTQTELGLADLRRRFADVHFDLTTTKGNDAARAARLELKTLRTSLEGRRKEVKAPLLERAALVDAEAKRITAEIVALEDPIDAQIKADEQRRAVEKAAKEQAERERIAAIRARIAAIAPPTDGLATAASSVIAAALTALGAVEINPELFGEFIDEAEGVKMRAHNMLSSLLRVAEGREAEAAELARQREEMARMKAELDAKLKAQQEEAERQQREINERAAAELKRLEEERAVHEAKLRAEREAHERQVAEERAQAEQKVQAEAIARETAAAAERQRLAAEKAENERAAAELKKQQDAFAEEQEQARQAVIRQRDEAEAKRLADLAKEEAARQAQAVMPQTQAIEAVGDFAELSNDPDFREVAHQVQTVCHGIPASAAGAQLSMVEQVGGPSRPADDEILEVLCDHFGVHASEALEWLTHFDVDAQVERTRVAA